MKDSSQQQRKPSSGSTRRAPGNREVAFGGTPVSGCNGDIVLRHLDSDVRRIHRNTMPFATRYLTEKAVDAIEHDLGKHHELDGSAIEFIP